MGYTRKLLGRKDPKQGSHIVLSIDKDIQRAAEQLLNSVKDPYGRPLNGAATMIDVETGEILAMATAPSFDPNRMVGRISSEYYDDISDRGGWINRATQGLYPPGSTFKLMVALAALENKFNPATRVYCGGSYQLGKRTFHCWKEEGHGSLDLVSAIIISLKCLFSFHLMKYILFFLNILQQ